MKAFISFALLAFAAASQAGITIGAYNIRNFDYDQRYKITTNKVELSTTLKSLNADVLSVEEINNTEAWDKFVATKMTGYDTEVSRCGGDHGQHLGFLWNKNTVEMLKFDEEIAMSNPGKPGTCDSGSRPAAVALFKIKATGQQFFGITLHLKSGNDAGSVQKRGKQYQILALIINTLKQKTGVKDYYFAGDLNTTEYVNRGADYVQLNQVVKSLGMVDVTSNLKCTAYYWGGTDDGIETPSMLDHIVVTPGLSRGAPRVQAHTHCAKVSCREVPIRELGISYESVSDHCPITATMQ